MTAKCKMSTVFAGISVIFLVMDSPESYEQNFSFFLGFTLCTDEAKSARQGPDK